MWMLKPNLDLLQEQPVLSATEHLSSPSVQSSCYMLRLWGKAVSKKRVVVSVTNIIVCDTFGDWEVSGVCNTGVTEKRGD